MAHIRIDYDGLAQQVSSLNSQIEQYETLGSRVRTLTGQMQSSWEGNACNQYISMMQNYMNQSEKITGILREFKGYAERASAEFRQTDHTCAQAIRSTF